MTCPYNLRKLVFVRSFVADTIRVTGNAAFHYDESLESFDTGNPYGIAKWRELISATDRAAYSTLMSF